MASPSIGLEIIDLSIRLGSNYSVEKDELKVEEGMKLLKSLNRVVILSISFSWLTTIMASTSISTTSLRSLKTLNLIGEPFPHRETALDPLSLRQFQSYPSLRTIDLDPLPRRVRMTEQETPHITRNPFMWSQVNARVDEEIARIENQLVVEGKQVEVENISESRITSFSDRGQYQSSNFLNEVGFNSLSSLSLIDSHTGLQTLAILENYSNPLGINNLTLHFNSFTPSRYSRLLPSPLPPDLILYPTFSRFQNLTHLTISCPSNNNFDFLKKFQDPLPLISLTFCKGTPISIDQLQYFLMHCPDSFRILRLNIVGGTIPEKRIAKLGLYREEENDRIITFPFPYPGWQEPQWTTNFDQVGLMNLIELSKETKIRIVGSSVEALNFSKLHRDECDLARKVYDEIRVGCRIRFGIDKEYWMPLY